MHNNDSLKNKKIRLERDTDRQTDWETGFGIR